MRARKAIIGAVLGFGVAIAAAAHGAGKSNGVALELNGRLVGWVGSATGGGVLVSAPSKVGAGGKAKAENPKYEDIKIECGAGMSPEFWDWIEASLSPRAQRQSGSVVTVDPSLKTSQRLDFVNAALNELVFPALDASSKAPATFHISLSPEAVRDTKGGPAAPVAGKEQALIVANFRFTIDGMKTAGVSHIEAITIKRAFTKMDAREVPAAPSISHVVFTLPESQAMPYSAWAKVAMKGPNGGAKNGVIQLLAPDLKRVLFTLDLVGLVPTQVTLEPSSTKSPNTRVEASVQSVQLLAAHGG